MDSLDGDLVLVKGHRDHSLKQNKYSFHTQTKTIIQPGCNKYLHFCGQADGMSFSHTLMVKQHSASEDTWPSRFRETSRQDLTKAGRNSPSFSPFRSKLLALKALFLYSLTAHKHSYFSYGNSYSSRESTLTEQLQELRGI